MTHNNKIKLPDTLFVYDADDNTRPTLRQMIFHAIGLTEKIPYFEQGKQVYKPWRNCYHAFLGDKDWEKLCEAGYAERGDIKTNDNGTQSTTYSLTRAGLDWMSRELNITILNPEPAESTTPPQGNGLA